MWYATLKLRRHDLWHLRRIAGDLEVDGRLCSAAFVQVGDAQVVTLENGRILAFTLAALMPSPEFSLKSHKLADARWTFASMPLFVLSFERTGGSKSQRSKWQGMVLC